MFEQKALQKDHSAIKFSPPLDAETALQELCREIQSDLLEPGSVTSYALLKVDDCQLHCYGFEITSERAAVLVLDEQHAFRVGNLAPYLSAALRLEWQFRQAREQREYGHLRLRALLQQFRLPAASVDERGDVVAQNSLMDVLTQQQGLELPAPDKKTTTNLPNENHSGFGTDGLVVRPAVLSNGTVVNVVAQSAVSHTGGIVYVLTADYLAAVSEQKLKEILGLTAKEARCCHLLAKGASASEIARAENKSVYTVREQLNACYRKAGVTNQLQLIAKLASFPAI